MGHRPRFRALFVGSGVQRKGLHHLLHAWHRARLPADSELTLVCRNLDPGLEELVIRSRPDHRFGVLVEGGWRRSIGSIRFS